MLFQVVASAVSYLAIRLLFGNELVAEGVMLGFLCPVASSVAVISCMLGADRKTVTTYTIADNLLVALIAPLAFTLIGYHPEMGLTDNFLTIFRKIGSTLALPFFIALAIQLLLPKVGRTLAKINIASFYLWAIVFCLTIGQTIHFIFEHGAGNWGNIAVLAVLAAVFCTFQFAFGRWMGARYASVKGATDDERHALIIGGGQLLGQKNSGFGIWMAATFLTPLSAVFLAFYSVYQNLFNAIQMAQVNKIKEQSK